MSRTRAVSIGISESPSGWEANVFLLAEDLDRKHRLKITWPRRPATGDDNHVDWLFACLANLVEHFDEHEVVRIDVQGVKLPTGGDNV